MDGKVTYRQQVSYCGKARCRRCSEGIGHGPYWYAYNVINGRTVRTYIGKELPSAIQATLEREYETPSPVTVPDGAEATIRVYTLGQFRLERRDGNGWQGVGGAAWQRQWVRSLLACLIGSPRRRLRREQLMDMLWPEQDVGTAAGRLDRAVYGLRQLFEPTRQRLATSPLLLTGRELIELVDQHQVWVDADAFEALLTAAPTSTDVMGRERLLEEAAKLYAGEFLPAERALELAVTRREFLRRRWIGLLLDLADLRVAHDLNNTFEPLERILAADPTNEAAVQRLIKLLAQQGRRGEALRVYEQLAVTLRQEYQIAPLAETRALSDAVRLGTVGEEDEASMTGGQDGSREVLAQIGRSHQLPLVGREQELALMRDLLAEIAQQATFKLPGQQQKTQTGMQRRPQTLLLLGEVGIGKTRLAEEMAREARGRGWAVAWGRLYPQEASIPYRLWIDVMRKAMEQASWQRQELRQRPLLYQPLAALLPELAKPLSQVALPPSLSPEQEQLRLWEAICELLITLSKTSPLFVALDDIQWADGSSCGLFAYLARRLHGLPIVIVGTCRDNEPDADDTLRPLLNDLQREHALATLPLQPLSDEQIGVIVSYIPHVTEPALHSIQMRAGGNPFFAEELARTMDISSEEIQAGASDSHAALPALPDTISAALDLRLSRLTASCQRLLSKAAVLGSSFTFHLINEMEASAPAYSEEGVLDLVEEALQAGVLTEEGNGTGITYQFWHPLLVTHLYEGLSAARRASFHRRAAEILQREFQGREEEGAATITYHLVRGGAAPRLVADFAELAGGRAYMLSAYPDAEHYYCLAIEHLGRTQPTREDALHLASLLEYAGECARLQGKDEEARHLYERTLEVRRQLLPSARLSQEEAQIQALLWCEIALTWYDTGDNTQARLYCGLGKAILREAAVQAGAAWASIRFLQGYIYWREGNYVEAQRSAEQALSLFEDMLKQQGEAVAHVARSTRLRRALAGDPVEVGRTSVLLGLIANGAGHSATAITHWNAALALFEQHDRQREIAVVCCNLGDVYLRKAEHRQAEAFFQRSLHIAERIGEIPSASIALGNMGVLALRSGDLSAAEDWFKRGLALLEQVNDPVYTSVLHAYVGITMQEQGKYAEARKHLAHSLKVGRAMCIAPCLGLALVAAGEMYLLQSEAMQGSDEAIARTEMLKAAQKAVQRALLLEDIEVETKIEGQLLLAHVDLLSGHTQQAYERAVSVLEEARCCELVWLIARAQRILGSILARQDQQAQAQPCFEQALEAFRKSGMHIEYERTLHEYEAALCYDFHEQGDTHVE